MSDVPPPDPGHPGQLTQVRVPLEDAALAFASRDAYGRLPIIVLPRRVSRVQAALLVYAGGLLAAGLFLGPPLGWGWLLPVAILGALILGVVAVFRSFVVVIPEGANGLLAQGGRYLRTLGSGSQFVLPHIAVSHLVTRRTIPFDVPVWQAPTADNVRARLDTLLTFSITDPYRFVFTISADDFDTVLSAICQDALRSLIRSLPADQLADLPRPATQGLLEAIALAMAPYGVSVHTVVVTQATPPPEFAAAQEARQLAAVELAAAEQQQRLALQRQQDRAALAHQQVLSEAASEAFRLAQLEERLAKYPGAARYDLARARLAVAQALAGNTRAMLQVGRLDDLAQALVLRDALPPAPDLAEPGPEVGEAAQRKVWPDDR